MGEGNNHIKIYTSEEIQSYLEGRMSPAEMHAMERAALEDPFLADAIEGYHQTGVKATDSEYALKQALQDRLTQSNRKQRIPAWLKMAAAVAVLVTSVVVITLLINPGVKNDAIVASQNEPRSFKDTTAVVEPALGNQNPQIKTESNKEGLEAHRPRAGNVAQRPASLPNKKEESLLKSSSERKSEDASSSLVAADEAAPERSIASPLNGKVSGVVIDSNKRPVPGATITVAKQQVVTDDSGLFALKPTDSVMNVEIQSAGFATRNAIVKDDAIMDTIVLRPSAAPLEEVVVAGYGPKRKARGSNRQASASNAIASPTIPWEEYNLYIRKALQASGKDTIVGEVIISFTANSAGKLTRFKLDKPAPTKEMNEYLIDLIKAGPKWQVVGGNSARGTVRIPLATGN